MRSTAWPTKRMSSGSPSALLRGSVSRSGSCDAVGDDAVAPAVPALDRPARGLRDGDPHVQPVEAPRRAADHGDRVGDVARGVDVERPDGRQAGRAAGVPRQPGRLGGVDVDDVVAAGTQLVAHLRDARRGRRDVRHRPVRGEAEGPPEGDQVLGQGDVRRACPCVQQGCPAGVAIDRGEHTDLVALGDQLLRKGLDMPRDTTRVRPRVRRDEGDPHGPTIFAEVPNRHFVKYTFLKVDPAWRRLDAEQRATDKRELAAACADFAEDHLLRAFSLVGTRGDAELMLLSQAVNLDSHPRVPRRPGPERPHEVGLDPLLVPGHDQGERVLRRVAPRGPPGARQVPLRLSLREDARLVRARREGAVADHAGAHHRSAGSSRAST